MTTSPSNADQEASGLFGSVGPRTSPLHDPGELRNALVGEFRGTAHAARDAAAHVDTEPRAAVHAYRKALRRARAVLQLLSRELPKGERVPIRRALQQARRALGFARDHAVAPATLEHLPLQEVERATATAIVSNAASGQPPVAEAKQLLAEGAARALAQVEALEAALPPEIRWSSVVKGVRSTYRAARRARRASKRDATAFHVWRRRSKELTYQLELLSRLAGEEVAALHHRLEAATDAQGPVVDLLMVCEFIRAHAHNIAPEAIEGLIAAIAPQLDDLLCDARSAGKKVFRAKPRKFERRIAKAIRKQSAAELESSIAS